MKYLLMIYENEGKFETMTGAERQSIYAEYRTLIDDVAKHGNWLGGEQLQPTVAATTVRLRDGKPLLTDGPFAETREQLGGFFLVEAKDLDEATAIAARIPSARTGSIEVRPIMTPEMR